MARKISRWYVTQGETFRRHIAFRVPNTVPAQYIPLDGSAFAMEIRAKAGGTGTADATATITITEDDITTPAGDVIPAGSAAYIEIDSAQTAGLKAAMHAFDVFRTNADDTVDVVAAGEFHVYARTTIVEAAP